MCYKEGGHIWSYHQTHVETEYVSHLFMHCKFSNAIWSHFFSIMGVNWVMRRDALKLICQWNSWFLRARGRILWKSPIHGILWGIWIERNHHIFEDKRKGLMMVVESIKLEVSKWAAASKHFTGIQLLYIYRDLMACDSLWVKINPCAGAAWELPPRGYLKPNFDGSSMGKSGTGGFWSTGEEYGSKYMLGILQPDMSVWLLYDTNFGLDKWLQVSKGAGYIRNYHWRGLLFGD